MMLHEIKYNAEIIKNKIVVDEDQQKIDLKNIYFKKSNDICYKYIDDIQMKHLNDNYQLEVNRYNYLVNKIFSNDPLDDTEVYELDYLTIKIGDYTTSNYIVKIIEHSKIALDLLYSVDSTKKVITSKIRLFVNYCRRLMSNTYSRIINSSSRINFFNSVNICNSFENNIVDSTIYLDSSPPEIV